MIIAPDVGSGVSWGLFRAQQPMPVEILHDNVSQYWPTALVALTMDESELRRLLVARRYDPQDERPHRRAL